MQARVPIIEHSIPEARFDPDEISKLFLRSLELDIPGFIVRRETSYSLPPLLMHKCVGDVACSILHTINPSYNPRLWLYQNNPVLSQKPLGNLHHDLHDSLVRDPTANETGYNVHTTLNGGGNVTLATFGANPAQAKGYVNAAHQQILDRQVNPDIINPHIYQGTVMSGDTVIITEGGRATAWHRFDTDPLLDERQAVATQIYSEDGNGFELIR